MRHGNIESTSPTQMQRVWYTWTAMALALLALSGCLLSEEEKDASSKAVDMGMVFALTSDYKTGSYAAYGLDSQFTAKDIAPIHSDAVVRFPGGSDILILNRLGRDNLQVVDRHNLATVMQIAFPPLSNPYDIALQDSLLYVGFYAHPSIGIYRQGDGEKQGEIDISAYADTSDGLPETTTLQFAGGNLYVLLANLDTKNGFAPLQARLLKVDPASKSLQALDLPFGNPVSIAFDSAANRLYIPCRGVFFNPDYSLALDGGIVSVDLASFSVSDTLVTEVGLQGGMNKALFHQDKLYMDLSASVDGNSIEKVIAISTQDASTSSFVQTAGYKVGGIAIDGETDVLYLGDKDEGLRAFDLASGQEKAESKISLGLPINDLVVVR